MLQENQNKSVYRRKSGAGEKVRHFGMLHVTLQEYGQVLWRRELRHHLQGPSLVPLVLDVETEGEAHFSNEKITDDENGNNVEECSASNSRSHL